MSMSIPSPSSRHSFSQLSWLSSSPSTSVPAVSWVLALLRAWGEAWQGPSSSRSGYPWHSLQLQLQGSLFSFGCLVVLLSATGSASSGAGLLLCLSSCASLGNKMYQSLVSPDIATTVPVHALGPFAFRGECFAEILRAGRGRQGSHFASQANQRVGGTLYGAVFPDLFLCVPTMSDTGYVWNYHIIIGRFQGPHLYLSQESAPSSEP